MLENIEVSGVNSTSNRPMPDPDAQPSTRRRPDPDDHRQDGRRRFPFVAEATTGAGLPLRVLADLEQQ